MNVPRFLTRTKFGKFRLFWQNRLMASTYVGGTGPESDVIIETIYDKAVITLNRPKALNALNYSMIKKILPFVKEWQESNDINMIIIKGTGDKAFCAGGDVRAIAEGKDSEMQNLFFKEEYSLNHAIGTSKVPWVALIDGITMGGGVGLSVHGNFRVATERTLFAMPETAIGLIPDVGGGYFLPRLSEGLGNYFALSGFRLKGRDVFTAGIATHFVESSKMKDLEGDLISLKDPTIEAISRILSCHHDKSKLDKEKPFILSPQQSLITKVFSSYNIDDIMKGLESDGSDWSMTQLAIINKMSPTSIKVTLEQFRRGKHMTLKEDLEMEYRIVLRIMQRTDFYEGVRALLKDKDLNPRWEPSCLNGVSGKLVEFHFEDLPLKEKLIL